MQLKLSPRHFEIFRKQLWRRLASRSSPCLLCRSRRLERRYKIPSVRTPVFRALFAEKIVECHDCGFVFTNPRLSEEALQRYYSKEFKLEGLDVPASKEAFLSDRYRSIWAEKERDVEIVLRHVPGGRLLDIGCASGAFLYLAREKGFKVNGVEVGRPAANFARSQLGLEVFCGQLEQAGFADGEFDAVSSIHSLEHVPDPSRVLSVVHRILRPGGIFYVAVPNLASWSAEKWGDRWEGLQPQNHYSHFTPRVLRSALESRGFSVLELFTEEGRFGEEKIRAEHTDEEIKKIYADMRGSELISVCRNSG